MSECDLWDGPIRKDGYGRKNLCRDGRKTSMLAHRWVWTKERGAIPAGWKIWHVCGNPRCVNLDHLYLARAEEVCWIVNQGLPTHCGRGHEFNEANRYVVPATGEWSCKRCRREYMRAYRKLQRGDVTSPAASSLTRAAPRGAKRSGVAPA